LFYCISYLRSWLEFQWEIGWKDSHKTAPVTMNPLLVASKMKFQQSKVYIISPRIANYIVDNIWSVSTTYSSDYLGHGHMNASFVTPFHQKQHSVKRFQAISLQQLVSWSNLTLLVPLHPTRTQHHGPKMLPEAERPAGQVQVRKIIHRQMDK